MQELNKMRNQALIGYILACVCIIIGFIILFSSIGIGILIMLIGFLELVVVSKTFGKSFKKAYKNKICKEVLEKMFDIHSYDSENGFSEDFVKNTYFIDSGNTYSSDDYVSGSYQGYEFERSDVCMQDVRSCGKSTTVVTLFKGSWTIFSFHKPISTYLLIREREFLSNGKPGGIFSNAPHTNKVKFEDLDFNERFDVYAQNEHDAFYVLTPHFIEKIKELEAKMDGRLIIGIHDNKVHVLFDNGKNAMEPSLLNEVSEDDYRVIEDEMESIIEIIETLDIMMKERD
ncbi:MAG: DUF3137 domain-containing protein [Traorella sp.]